MKSALVRFFSFTVIICLSSFIAFSQQSATTNGPTHNLTLVDIERHPFGFIPSNVKKAVTMINQLKDMNWPIDDDSSYGSRTLSIWSYNAIDPKHRKHDFIIPYTLYCEPIAHMTAYFDDKVNLDSYDFMISKYIKDWSVDKVYETIKLIRADLEKLGFEYVKSEDLGVNDIIAETVYEKGSTWIRLRSGKCTKSTKLDSYEINISIEL